MIQRRQRIGFGYGVVATIAMTLLMLVAVLSGKSPMPRPIPQAVVVQLFGDGLATPVLLGLAVGLHLGYGGLFGALLASVVQQVTVARGVLLGVVLWGVMQLVVLPFLGWGPFGTTITPKIAVATLVLHLVYGGTLGWTLEHSLPS